MASALSPNSGAQLKTMLQPLKAVRIQYAAQAADTQFQQP
jgi:hypothetical protein